MKAKYLVIVGIIALLAFFFIKDNFKSKKHHIYNTQKDYVKTKEELLFENKSKIDSLTDFINICLKKVKFKETKQLNTETEILLDYFIYLNQKQKDSINRLKANNDIVNKTLESNTLVFSLNNNSQLFNLNTHIFSKLISRSYEDNFNKKHNKKNTYESLIGQFLNTEYLVVINNTKKINPKKIDDKNFKSGFIVASIYYFDLKKTKLIKTANIVVENSSKVYITEIEGRIINENELNDNLNQNYKKEIDLLLFGRNKKDIN